MSSNPLILAINRLSILVNSVEKRVNVLEGNPQTRQSDTPLPVHNGHKIEENLQDSVDSAVQRVDYVENSIRELKRQLDSVSEAIKKVSIEDKSKGAVANTKSVTEQVKAELNQFKTSELDVTLTTLKNSIATLDKDIKNEIHVIKNAYARNKLQSSEVSGSLKSIEAAHQLLQKRVADQEQDVSNKFNILTEKIESDILDLKQKQVDFAKTSTSTLKSDVEQLHTTIKKQEHAITMLQNQLALTHSCDNAKQSHTHSTELPNEKDITQVSQNYVVPDDLSKSLSNTVVSLEIPDHKDDDSNQDGDIVLEKSKVHQPSSKKVRRKKI